MLLDRGEEVGGSAGGEDDRFSAEGADFGAADGKDVTEGGQVGQGEVARGAHEAVAQAGAVDKQGEAVLKADFADGGKFCLGIQRSVLRGEGDVHQPGEDHVVEGGVGIEALQVGGEVAGLHLSFVGRQGEDFVAGVFHGAGFVHGDMAGLCSHGAFKLPEKGGNDGGVGLRAAGEEVHVGPGAGAGFPDALTGRCRKPVGPVPLLLVQIGSEEALQDSRMRPFGIVTGKRDHYSAGSSFDEKCL